MKWLKNNKGFTLVEVLASLVVVTVLIVAIIGFFTNGFSSIAKLGERGRSMHKAQKEVESVDYMTASSAASNLKIGGEGSAIEIPGKLEKRQIGSSGREIALFIPAPDAWHTGIYYEVGDTVTFGGHSYECVQAHTSSDSLQPSPAAAAYWNAL